MEQNRVLNQIYNSLMQVPHRDYAPLVAAFSDALRDHPAFASHAMVYVVQNSKIRDQVDCAIISLLQADSAYLNYREAGQVLLLGNGFYKTNYPVNGLPPFRIFRIADFIHQSNTKIPRRMKSIMNDYLSVIQNDQLWFDSLVLHNRSSVKSAYHTYHVKANDLAEAIIFNNAPPEGSKLHALKLIANADSEEEQARLIMQNKIPYRIAQSVLPGGFTPLVGIALIDVMSPNDALNSRQWVERSGLLQMPEVRDAYVAKLANAQSVATADHRKSAQGSDETVQAAIDEAKETAVAKENRIGGQVDIWLDVSYSMQQAIEITPQFASRIWPLCDDVAIIAHNSSAWEIAVQDTGSPLQDVRNALHGTRAGGGTLFVPALQKSRQLGRNPQRIVMLTDGGANRSGLASALGRYEEETGIVPLLTMIEVRGTQANDDVLSRELQQAGFEIEKYKAQDLDGNVDYFVFDQVVSFLSGDVVKSLVEKIMELELPRRVKQ